MQPLLQSSGRLFKVVQFPDVFGAWVATTYYHKWRKYLEKKFLHRLQKESNFEFTGFGESSPYAIFAALAFLKKYQPEKRPIVVTFGQPRMGNEIFVAYAQSKLEIYRVTLEDDWLPNLPLRGVRKFSKWNDKIERSSELSLIYEEYKHFTPEFWIELQKDLISKEIYCECPESDYSLVYECYNTHSLEEHPECNARNHDFDFPRQLKYFGKSNDFRYGPYFEKNMRNCENLETNDLLKETNN
ncbi:hypothetical protein G9A89_001241 [Geosiphon pyriformis]|nr:hypothetical protein G9A89_001241 [Geosiphon pyriformis]